MGCGPVKFKKQTKFNELIQTALKSIQNKNKVKSKYWDTNMGIAKSQLINSTAFGREFFYE